MFKAALAASATAVQINQNAPAEAAPEVQQFWGALFGGLQLLWSVFSDEEMDNSTLKEAEDLISAVQNDPKVNADIEAKIAAGSFAQTAAFQAEGESPEVQQFWGTLFSGLELLWNVFSDEGMDGEVLGNVENIITEAKTNDKVNADIQAKYDEIMAKVLAQKSLAQVSQEKPAPEVQQFFGTLIAGLSLLWTVFGDEGMDASVLEGAESLIAEVENNPKINADLEAMIEVEMAKALAQVSQDAPESAPEVQQFFGTLIAGLSLLWTVFGDEGMDTSVLEGAESLVAEAMVNPKITADIELKYEEAVESESFAQVSFGSFYNTRRPWWYTR